MLPPDAPGVGPACTWALSFVLLLAWPFTRLVHVWSLPLAYLRRPPCLDRARTAPPRRRRALPVPGRGAP